MLARNPNSLLSFIAWLEKQDATARYDYNSTSCAVCLYLEEQGGSRFDYGKFLTAEDRIAVVQEHPRTYGAALKRALAHNSK